jgi:hypothetical protein
MARQGVISKGVEAITGSKSSMSALADITPNAALSGEMLENATFQGIRAAVTG